MIIPFDHAPVKVLALTKYDREAASTRQRLLQYCPAFAQAGIEVEYHPLLGDAYVRSLTGKSTFSRAAIAAAYLKRFASLLQRPKADLVFVYAELFPWLPALFERRILHWGLPLIYDFDDAFFVPYDQHPRPAVRKLLRHKLRPLIEGAAACTCGNTYLRDHAAQWCKRSLIVPTVIDTDRYLPRPKPADAAVVIGWIGSPSTWPQVKFLLPLLEQVCATHAVRFLVVGAGRMAEADRFEGMDLVDWSEDREIQLVQAMDIGIMPLVDSPFVRGKSGYKLIQYMACGLPTVASPIGVNSEIVSEAETGFLADSLRDWERALTRLLADAALRQRLGAAGRARAVAHYSLASQVPRLVALFREVATEQQAARAKA